MWVFKNLRYIDKKFALGTIIGAIGLGYAFYVDSFRENNPRVIFEVISNTNVLDLKEDVSKLDILYGTESIKRKKENLRILTVKISNDGNENIVETHYDSNNPFGFNITKGRIIERPELLETSIDYFKRSLKIDIDSTGKILLNKIQFDEKQFFVLKVLVLCSQDSIPEIKPFGKISGITEDFTVKIKIQGEEEKSFWKRLIEGTPWIHFLRFWFYFLVLIVFSLTIALPVSFLSDSFLTAKRKKRIKKFKENSKIELTLITESIFEIYLREGEGRLKTIQHILSKPDIFRKILKYENEEIERTKLYNELEISEVETHEPRISGRLIVKQEFQDTIVKLKQNGVVKQEADSITVDADYEKTLAEFLYFLKVQ